ncbi:MAG: GNAT family N-acetyltransferase [Nostocaceae cyanobacterium]|nr:GNAT family N-acetyltransferase [Nostocaceae cyanobacterium]
MRQAIEEDLPRIVEIYNCAVPTRQSTADINPVSVESRREWFHQHNFHHRPLLVEEQDRTIIGWVSLKSFYGRPAYECTVEVSIYVAAECRGQGIGKKMLKQVLELAPSLGVKNILAYIFSHNEPSIRLFRSCGFELWGVLPKIAQIDDKKYSLSIYGKHLEK